MNKSDIAFVSRWAKKIKAINLLGGKCKKCGEKRIEVLSFHHQNGLEKEYEVSKMFRNYRWSIIEKEITKCELLCENCHKEIHDNFQNKETKTKRNKSILLEYLKEKSCSFCGYCKNNNALNFHHFVKDKEFSISNYINTKKIKSLVEIEQELVVELEKCQLVCSNCHLSTHFDNKRFEKFKDIIYIKSKSLKEQRRPVDKNEVLRLHKKGLKQIEISKELKCLKSTVCGIIKNYSRVPELAAGDGLLIHLEKSTS